MSETELGQTEMLRIFLSVAVIVVLLTTIDFALFSSGLPIRVLDLIFFPVSLFLIYAVFRYKHRWLKNNHNEIVSSLSSLKTLGLALMLIFLFVMGGFLALNGIKNPLVLYESVKGDSHGYTEAACGCFVVVCSLVGLFVLVKVKLHQWRN